MTHDQGLRVQTHALLEARSCGTPGPQSLKALPVPLWMGGVTACQSSIHVGAQTHKIQEACQGYPGDSQEGTTTISLMAEV